MLTQERGGMQEVLHTNNPGWRRVKTGGLSRGYVPDSRREGERGPSWESRFVGHRRMLCPDLPQGGGRTWGWQPRTRVSRRRVVSTPAPACASTPTPKLTRPQCVGDGRQRAMGRGVYQGRCGDIGLRGHPTKQS